MALGKDATLPAASGKPQEVHRENNTLFQPKLLSHRATIPARANEPSAGVDLYAYLGKYIAAREQAKVITVPVFTYGGIESKSGLIIKHGVNVEAGVNDGDYRGELIVEDSTIDPWKNSTPDGGEGDLLGETRTGEGGCGTTSEEKEIPTSN